MMQTKQHHYTVRTVWSGATARATRDYRSFSREHAIEVEGKALLKASADPSFRGDAGLHNPEDMLVAALSGCGPEAARQVVLGNACFLCAGSPVERSPAPDRGPGAASAQLPGFDAGAHPGRPEGRRAGMGAPRYQGTGRTIGQRLRICGP